MRDDGTRPTQLLDIWITPPPLWLRPCSYRQGTLFPFFTGLVPIAPQKWLNICLPIAVGLDDANRSFIHMNEWR